MVLVGRNKFTFPTHNTAKQITHNIGVFFFARNNNEYPKWFKQRSIKDVLDSIDGTPFH